MDIFKKAWFWIIIVAVIVAGGIVFYGTMDDADDIAIRVNDETFTHEEFDQITEQIAQEYQMYGMPVDDEQIKEQAIDRAIQEVLLTQYADDEGLEVSQEEIDDKFDELMMMYGAQSEEEFLAQLQADGIEDRQEVDELLELELKINKLVDLYGEEVEISDEELEQAYSDYEEQMEQMQENQGIEEDIPSFEEMEADLEADLVQQQVTPLLLEKIDELRELADIEIYVDQEDVDVEAEEEDVDQMMPEGDDAEGMEIEIDADDVEGGEVEIDPEDLE